MAQLLQDDPEKIYEHIVRLLPSQWKYAGGKQLQPNLHIILQVFTELLANDRAIINEAFTEMRWAQLASNTTDSIRNEQLLAWTEDQHEHPEWYEGPCYCRLCMSYD